MADRGADQQPAHRVDDRGERLVLGAASRDDDALTLEVPNDGSVAFLRAVLSRLDAESVGVAALSVDTPDLDDVFLTLTGHPDTTKDALR